MSNATPTAQFRPSHPSKVFDEQWYRLELERMNEQWDREYESGSSELMTAAVMVLRDVSSEECTFDTVTLALRRIGNYIGNLENLCCGISQKCCGTVTPDFATNELRLRIFAAIDDRVAAIRNRWSNIHNNAGELLRRQFNLQAAEERLEREIVELKTKLNRYCDTKAIELKYEQPSSVRESASPGAHRSPDVAKRREIVRQNQIMGAEGLCELFHTSGISLPQRMQEASSWLKAFKAPQYRHAIEALISRDKKAIRRQ